MSVDDFAAELLVLTCDSGGVLVSLVTLRRHSTSHATTLDTRLGFFSNKVTATVTSVVFVGISTTCS